MESPTENKGIRLSLSEVQSFAPSICPHCQKPMIPANYANGDTVDLNYEDDLDYHFNVAVNYGSCQHCEKSFSSLEISHISHPVDGYHFMNLHDYHSQSRKSYEVSGLGYGWGFEHHRNVTGLFFTAAEKNRIPRQFTGKEPVLWLNIHWVDPAALCGYENTIEGAREIFYRLKPEILSFDLDNLE
ncbi:MAG: hypothetical protein JKX75_06400 [Gammaproteobacteria bacterium]|nr:hypothetical protein [Gammaproteobacteria bacterium]